ncbi:hypothetical protein ACFLZ1_02990 [Patescibacteria group bacterium]
MKKRKIAIKSVPEILDIWEIANIKKAVKIAAKGEPIVFACLGIYGLGGLAKAFTNSSDNVPSISVLKDNRNFTIHPPVALPSWKKLEKLVDWEKMSHDKITDFMEKLYSGLPIHIVLPVRSQAKKLLPFAKVSSKGILSHAFMCSGTYKPLQTLIQLFEEKTNGVFLGTSANPTGIDTYMTAEKVAESFPKLSIILADYKFDALAETTNWVSHTMYDFTHFPEDVRLVRKGSVHHELMIVYIDEFGIQIKIDITEVKTLTEEPPIDSFDKLKELMAGF